MRNRSDCFKILHNAGFNRWKVTGDRYRLRVGSTRLEIQINQKPKPYDNSQKTTQTGHNDPITTIDL